MRIPLSNITTDRWMERNSNSINRIVIQHLPKSEFNAEAVSREQARRLQLLPNCEANFASSWSDLDTCRRSAACRYEWGRLQMFLAAEVLPRLADIGSDLYLVTLADKRWRVSPEAATAKVFERPRRKFRSAIQTLRDRGFEPVFVASYEMSGNRSLDDGYSFEPHFHLVVGGVPKADLKRALRVRLSRAARGRDKPLKVRALPAGEIGNVLGYLSKIKAQDRVEFVRSDGRRDRTSNRMPTEQKLLWLRCMAAMPIAQLIQFGGFAEPITPRFIHREMATLLGELA